MKMKNILRIIGKFTGWPDLLLVLLVVLSLNYCHRNLEIVRPSEKYSATLEEGMLFSRSGTPKFVKKITGFAGPEIWGRWSDQDVSTIEFVHKLPKRFIVELRAQGFGPNNGKEANIKFGDAIYKVRITDEPQTFLLSVVTNEPVNMMEIFSPAPTSPNSMNPLNPDTRRLGIGLISMKIKPI